MQELIRTVFVTSFVLALSACGASTSLIYVTDDTFAGASYTELSYGEPMYDATGALNMLADFTDTVSYGGFSWLVYEIPSGEWDVYAEWDVPGNSYNGRERVHLEPGSSANEWAALWLTSEYGAYFGSTEGGGEFAPSGIGLR